MAPCRQFSSSQGLHPTVRDIDGDAPIEMRRELVDAIFSICEGHPEEIDRRRIYEISSHSIGAAVAGNPYGGYRYAVGRDIAGIEWNRVYDLIVRLWQEFSRANLQDDYRNGVNGILAGYGIVWDLNGNGRLQRILPSAAQGRVQAAIQELSNPRFSAAAQLFNDARDAYDDRPRRDVVALGILKTTFATDSIPLKAFVQASLSLSFSNAAALS